MNDRLLTVRPPVPEDLQVDDVAATGIIDLLRANDGDTVLKKLVDDGLIPKEFTAVLGDEILSVFVHVRKLLIAANELQTTEEELYGRLVATAKTNLIKGLFVIRDQLQAVILLSGDSIGNLRILAEIMKVTSLDRMQNQEIDHGIKATRELVRSSGRLIEVAAMRILSTFIERSGTVVKRYTSTTKLDVNGRISVEVEQVYREVGDKVEDLRGITQSLFPNILLTISYTEGHDFAGAGATRPKGVGKLTFTYDPLVR